MKKSVHFNFIMNFLLTASSLVFPLITYPYVSRVLGPAGMGQNAFAVSMISYFIMIAMLGVPTYGIRACAQVRDDREKLSQTVQELMLLNLIMAAASYVLLGACMLLIPRFRELKLLLWVTSTGILLNAVGVNWFYSAIEEYAYITVRSITFKVLAIGVMFLFVRSPDDVVWYAVVTLIASYGSYILNFIRLRRFISFRRTAPYDLRRHIKVALLFFAMAVATTVYTNLDVVMLEFMTDDTIVGYYNTAVKVKQILVSLVTSLGAVLLPRLSYFVEKGDREEFYKILRKAVAFVLFAAIPLMAFFILCAEETVLVLSGDQFLPAVPAMRIIMPTVLLIGLTNVLGIQIMVPTGQEKKVTLSVVIGGVTDLILNAVLIPVLGAAGAALGTLAAEIAVLIAQVLMSREILRRLERPPWGKIIMSTAVATAATLGVKFLLPVGHVLIRLILEIVVFAAVFGVSALAMREPFLREEILIRLGGLLRNQRQNGEKQ